MIQLHCRLIERTSERDQAKHEAAANQGEGLFWKSQLDIAKSVRKNLNNTIALYQKKPLPADPVTLEYVRQLQAGS